MLSEFLISFVTMFIVIDPFLSIPIFLRLTKGYSQRRKAKEAFIAVSVAGGLLLFFLFLGVIILDIMKISFSAFQIAGGLILIIMGIQTILNIGINKSSKQMKGIVIGTPLLCGPGAMTTIVILAGHYGYFIPILASMLVLVITWLMLHYSELLQRLFGDDILDILSRVTGFLLAAMAVEFIFRGIEGLLERFGY
ncbi:MAG: MarC family protein [Candidatus Aenigmatarchaeota archaeon]